MKQKNPLPITHDPLPASNQIAVAVIGSGYWGKNLVRNFYQLGVLKTICDGAPRVREEMAKTYPDVSVTGDIDGIMKDKDIQCVVIAAPAVHHFSHGYLLCESIFITDVTDGALALADGS